MHSFSAMGCSERGNFIARSSHGQNKTEIQFINPKAKDDVLITINSYHGKGMIQLALGVY